jgi:hypothetical protein
MKPIFYLILLFFLVSCNGKHIERYSVDINDLKTLPDNFYHYYRGAVIVSKSNDVMIWYTIDVNGDILKILKVLDNKSPKASTAQTIDKYALDTLMEKASAVRFTQLSHKYHFGKIKVDHKNKIAYSTNEDIVEEYVYPFNDSITAVYKNDDIFTNLKNGWFKCKTN